MERNLTVIEHMDIAVREIELVIEILRRESDYLYENKDNQRGNIRYDAKGILGIDLARLKDRRDYLVRVLAIKDN